MSGHRDDRNMAAFCFFAIADGLDCGKCIHLCRFHVHENQIKTQGAKLGQRLPVVVDRLIELGVVGDRADGALRRRHAAHRRLHDTWCRDRLSHA